MKPQDQAFLILAAVSFLVSLIHFFYRRIKGKSRTESTFMAVLTFGCLCAFGTFIFADNLMDTSRGMGLERYVLPPIIAFVGFVASTLISLIVYILENRKPPSSLTLKTKSTNNLTKKMPNTLTNRNDWRAFARDIAQS